MYAKDDWEIGRPKGREGAVAGLDDQTHAHGQKVVTRRSNVVGLLLR